MIHPEILATLRAHGASEEMIAAAISTARKIERKRQQKYRARTVSQDMSQDMSQDKCHKTEKHNENNVTRQPPPVTRHVTRQSRSDSLLPFLESEEGLTVKEGKERKEGSAEGRKEGKGRKHSLPLDWRPASLVCCQELGWSRDRIERELAKFADHARAHGSLYIDWEAAWRNWCRSPYQVNGALSPAPRGRAGQRIGAVYIGGDIDGVV